ncbi:mediator of RNA polymerase II transcription subunit 15 isoform X1 [Lutzomyia longipalpis]|nr:mediator of RNA polymerase II transcription subunit 15 isoform X1 [Lutzomyia longipalpis]
MSEDNSWRTPSFRQNVVAKINEAIQSSGMNTTKSSIEMENHVFVKARNKDEYLSFVARLILHVREMNTKNKMQGSCAGEVNNTSGMPDPINALQNLASQGSRPQQQMMGMGGPQGAGGPMGGPGGPQGSNIPASNLLQTLTQQQAPMQGMQQMQNQRPGGGGPGPMQNQMGGGGQMGMGMGGMNQGGGGGPPGPGGMPMGPGMNAGVGPGGGPGGPGGPGPMQMNPGGIQGQPGQMGQMGGMGQMGMNPGMSQAQMGNAMTPVSMSQAGGMGPQGGGPMGGPMNAGPMGGMGPMGPGMMGPMTTGANVVMQPNQQGGMNPAITTQGGGMGPNAGQMNPAQLVGMQQMARKGPEMMMTQQGGVFPGVRSVTPNQFLRQSPSPSVPSPASMGQPHQQGMVPSPAMVPSPSPQSMAQGPPRSMGVMSQSPSSTLNTPGQASVYSPLNPQEDLLYREKYRQLTKYIEPLKRMIARMVNDKNNGNLQKMNKLLEILCNPNQRIPLETLLKCEKALEKMDFKTNVLGPVSAQGANAKEHPINNPLLEAVSANLQNPIGNHTLQRTFRPCLEALFGPDIKNLPPPAKQARLSSPEEPPAATSGPEIPHTLQGEIARLDQKFKINLDPSAQMGTKTIKLVCCLDDKYLPCVPPVCVSIPEDYPKTGPTCNLLEQEYNATPFLVAIQKALTARISKLPRDFTLSHLLDSWELSVRQACAPVQVKPSQTTVLLGI